MKMIRLNATHLHMMAAKVVFFITNTAGIWGGILLVTLVPWIGINVFQADLMEGGVIGNALIAIGAGLAVYPVIWIALFIAFWAFTFFFDLLHWAVFRPVNYLWNDLILPRI